MAIALISAGFTATLEPGTRIFSDGFGASNAGPGVTASLDRNFFTSSESRDVTLGSGLAGGESATAQNKIGDRDKNVSGQSRNCEGKGAHLSRPSRCPRRCTQCPRKCPRPPCPGKSSRPPWRLPRSPRPDCHCPASAAWSPFWRCGCCGTRRSLWGSPTFLVSVRTQGRKENTKTSKENRKKSQKTPKKVKKSPPKYIFRKKSELQNERLAGFCRTSFSSFFFLAATSESSSSLSNCSRSQFILSINVWKKSHRHPLIDWLIGCTWNVRGLIDRLVDWLIDWCYQ